MNILTNIEYRGYSTYEIDSLVKTGQAAALGHGPGRAGAYNWIDSFFDHSTRDHGKYHPKPTEAVREKLLMQNEALYAVRQREANSYR